MRLLKRLPIHPTFYLLFAWFVAIGQTVQFFILVLVLLVHELGHFFVAKRLKYKLSSFYLAPYGVALNYKEGRFLGYDEIKIALAGPLANLFSCILIVAVWWVFPAIYSFTYTFVQLSLSLAVLNALPAYPLDGGRVLVSLLSERIPRKRALKISIWLNGVFCLIFFVLFVVSCFVNYNPTLALMCVFLLGGILETKMEGKYQMADLFNKKIKNLSQVKSLAVREDATLGELMRGIDPSKLTMFYLVCESGKTKILTEKKVLSLCMTHPINTKLKDLDLV